MGIDMQVDVKPYELFEVSGHWFLMKIKSLRHQAVRGEDVLLLSERKNQTVWEADEAAMSVLKRYGLRSESRWDEEAELKRLKKMCREHRTQNRIGMMELFVSQSCNMSCGYCYGSDGSYHRQGMMDWDTAKKAIDWLYENAAEPEQVNIVFFGGEPLMNFPLIKKSIAYAEETFGAGRITYGMATNMTLMSDEYLDFLAALPKFYLLVSFDGPREVQNRQRPMRDGRDSYDVCAERIKAALRRGIYCTGRATVYADTDRQAVVEEMKKLGLSNWQLTPASGCASDGIRRDHAARLNAYWLRTMPGQITGFVEAVKRRDKAAADLLMKDDDLHKIILEGVCGAELPRGIFGCSAGCSHLAVSAAGELYPCHRFVGMQEFCSGNLLTGERKEGWREFGLERMECFRQCETCFLRYMCGGACYYQCYTDGQRKSIYSMPEHFCDFMRMYTRLQIYVSHMLDEEDKRWYFTRRCGQTEKACP